MSERALGDSAPLPVARGAPLLVTAELPPDILVWADALRRTHYPPARNRLRAHVTLIHGLPPSADGEVRALLSDLARLTSPPPAQFTGLMDLGRGTAFAVNSPATEALHALIADRLLGIIQQKDARPLRLHVTVQNKVSTEEARALQAELARSPHPGDFRFRGFGLYAWDGDLWRLSHVYPFRGRCGPALACRRHMAVDRALREP